jgi:signal transduction histidine kinase
MARRTASVRFRVTGLATVIVAALLIVVAVVLVVVQSVTLTAALDANLGRRADGLAAQFALGGLPETLPGSGDDDAAQLVAAWGAVVAASTNLAGAAVVAGDPGSTDTTSRVVIDALEGDAFRVLSRRIEVDGEPLILHVAAAVDDVGDSVRILAWSLAVALPTVIALVAAMVWWLVGRALAPVESIRVETESVGPSELDHRVPVPDTDDEIAALARTMNAMLARLQSGAERQQAFVADASHELRSPLTRIRSELEVDLNAAENADLVATHRSVLQEAIEMERLLADLLFLARSDAGELSGTPVPVDLDDLLFREAERARAAAGTVVDTSAVSAAQLLGDPAQLARAIRNLIDNAVHHARTRVRIGLGESDGRAVLTVEDDGPGIPPDESERVFERFARVDQGRTRSEGGTGLGLAITADIVHRHTGTIEVHPADGGGARFVVRLPLDPTDAPHDRRDQED